MEGPLMPAEEQRRVCLYVGYGETGCGLEIPSPVETGGDFEIEDWVARWSIWRFLPESAQCDGCIGHLDTPTGRKRLEPFEGESTAATTAHILSVSLFLGGLAGSFDARLSALLSEYTAAGEDGYPVPLLDEAEERGLVWPGKEHQDRYAALLLLEELGKQAEWGYGCRTMPGYGHAAREIAEDAVIDAGRSGDDWRPIYLAAAARLRSDLRAAGAPQAGYEDWITATGRHEHVWLPCTRSAEGREWVSLVWKRCPCGVYEAEVNGERPCRDSRCDLPSGHVGPHFDSDDADCWYDEDAVDPNLAMLHDEPNLTPRPETGE